MNYCKVFCLFQDRQHFTRRFVMQFNSSLARALYTIIDYIKNRIISQNLFGKQTLTSSPLFFYSYTFCGMKYFYSLFSFSYYLILNPSQKNP